MNPQDEALSVTQADRDAASNWLHGAGNKPLHNKREHELLSDAFARHRLSHSTPGDAEVRAGTIAKAEAWLRACSDWLLSNDLDMKMPKGVLDTDPLDIADDLGALLSAGNDTLRQHAFSHVCSTGKTDAVVPFAVAKELLSAALATPSGRAQGEVEPVAYRYVHLDYAGRKVSRYGTHPERVNGHDPVEVHPLYAGPPAQAWLPNCIVNGDVEAWLFSHPDRDAEMESGRLELFNFRMGYASPAAPPAQDQTKGDEA